MKLSKQHLKQTEKALKKLFKKPFYDASINFVLFFVWYFKLINNH